MTQQAPPKENNAQKGTKKVLLAKHHGFCHGVKKSVNKTIEADEDSPKEVFVLGELIHNRQMIDKLDAQGIKTVESLDDIPSGSRCVIRTHGAPPELLQQAAERGIETIDATCPDVLLVQNKAIELGKEGYTVVVVGKSYHPEVIGITAHAMAQVDGIHIVAINDPVDIIATLKDIPHRRVGVVSQTTQKEENFFEIVKELTKITKELKVFNTICPATFFRQNAAVDLAREVDFMVVIGGKNSSNTTHLAEICGDVGTDAIHIETYQELVGNPNIEKASVIGVTAGASTPEWLVEEVVDYLEAL